MRRAPLALMLLLVGCSLGNADLRRAALNTTIGMDEATLVRTVGVPTRTLDADGHRFLAYADHRTQAFAGFAGYGGFGPFGFYGGGVPVPVERVCETTYELADGRVKSWTLRGEACATEASGVGVPVAPPS